MRALAGEPVLSVFRGEEFFQHKLVFDRSSMTRWRQRMGEDKLQALLQESLAVAVKTEAIEPKDLSRVAVDTTVMPKNVAFPTNAKLMHRARELLVSKAKRLGVVLRQSYVRVGKRPLIGYQVVSRLGGFNRSAQHFLKYSGVRSVAKRLSRPRVEFARDRVELG